MRGIFFFKNYHIWKCCSSFLYLINHFVVETRILQIKLKILQIKLKKFNFFFFFSLEWLKTQLPFGFLIPFLKLNYLSMYLSIRLSNLSTFFFWKFRRSLLVLDYAGHRFYNFSYLPWYVSTMVLIHWALWISNLMFIDT